MLVLVIKLNKQATTTWRIIPHGMPMVVKYCSKCNKKMNFYCSEKFRLNANQQRVDIWLIYKCTKCDTTWKLSLMRGMKPADIPAELFDRLTNNDAELAQKYAFDRQLLKQSGCEIDYNGVGYSVEGLSEGDIITPLNIRLESQYFFDLKLSAFLAGVLKTSVSNIKKLAAENLIATSLDCDIMKYRIRTDFDLEIKRACARVSYRPIS